jgi:hypothetical protein
MSGIVSERRAHLAGSEVPSGVRGTIDRYLSWRRQDGTHLDRWLRTHERLGADIVKVAAESMVPIEIDHERDEGAYVEPNVWMVHLPPPATEP